VSGVLVMRCVNACYRSAEATVDISISQLSSISTLRLNSTASPTESILQMLQPRLVVSSATGSTALL